jgi:hypothetical protein
MTRLSAFTLTLILGAALSLSCLDEGPVLTPDEPENAEANTEDCSAILGKAFASVEQRQWFIDNCSDWPQRDVPEVSDVDARPTPVQTDTPECAAMRGKPYESSEQRQWFLANCVQAVQTTPPVNQTGTDRTSCSEIRGTQYRSQTERQWFLSNCLTLDPGRQANDDDDDEPRGNRGRGNRNEDEDD